MTCQPVVYESVVCQPTVQVPAYQPALSHSEQLSQNTRRLYTEGKRDAAKTGPAPEGTNLYYFSEGQLYDSNGARIGSMALDPKTSLAGKDTITTPGWLQNDRGQNWNFTQQNGQPVFVDQYGRASKAEIRIGAPPGMKATMEYHVADIMVTDPRYCQGVLSIARHAGNIIVYKPADQVKTESLDPKAVQQLFDSRTGRIELPSSGGKKSFDVHHTAQNDGADYVYLMSTDGTEQVRLSRSKADGTYQLERQLHQANQWTDCYGRRMYGNVGWVPDTNVQIPTAAAQQPGRVLPSSQIPDPNPSEAPTPQPPSVPVPDPNAGPRREPQPAMPRPSTAPVPEEPPATEPTPPPEVPPATPGPRRANVTADDGTRRANVAPDGEPDGGRRANAVPDPTRRANVAPDPSGAASAQPDPTRRAVVAPDSSGAAAAQPDPTRRAVVAPDSSGAAAAQPDPTRRAVVAPDASGSPAAQPDPTRRAVVAPDASGAASAQPDPTRRAAVAPDASGSAAAQPDPTRTAVVAPDATGATAPQPDPTRRAAVAPDASGSAAAQPDPTRTAVVAPDATGAASPQPDPTRRVAAAPDASGNAAAQPDPSRTAVVAPDASGAAAPQPDPTRRAAVAPDASGTAAAQPDPTRRATVTSGATGNPVAQPDATRPAGVAPDSPASVSPTEPRRARVAPDGAGEAPAPNPDDGVRPVPPAENRDDSRPREPVDPTRVARARSAQVGVTPRTTETIEILPVTGTPVPVTVGQGGLLPIGLDPTGALTFRVAGQQIPLRVDARGTVPLSLGPNGELAVDSAAASQFVPDFLERMSAPSQVRLGGAPPRQNSGFNLLTSSGSSRTLNPLTPDRDTPSLLLSRGGLSFQLGANALTPVQFDSATGTFSTDNRPASGALPIQRSLDVGSVFEIPLQVASDGSIRIAPTTGRPPFAVDQYGMVRLRLNRTSPIKVGQDGTAALAVSPSGYLQFRDATMNPPVMRIMDTLTISDGTAPGPQTVESAGVASPRNTVPTGIPVSVDPDGRPRLDLSSLVVPK
ncbi:MAG: hypothetical protein U0136_10125 [Bdellovibrionota bacterium]